MHEDIIDVKQQPDAQSSSLADPTTTSTSEHEAEASLTGGSSYIETSEPSHNPQGLYVDENQLKTITGTEGIGGHTTKDRKSTKSISTPSSTTVHPTPLLKVDRVEHPEDEIYGLTDKYVDAEAEESESNLSYTEPLSYETPDDLTPAEALLQQQSSTTSITPSIRKDNYISPPIRFPAFQDKLASTSPAKVKIIKPEREPTPADEVSTNGTTRTEPMPQDVVKKVDESEVFNRLLEIGETEETFGFTGQANMIFVSGQDDLPEVSSSPWTSDGIRVLPARVQVSNKGERYIFIARDEMTADDNEAAFLGEVFVGQPYRVVKSLYSLASSTNLHTIGLTEDLRVTQVRL